MALIRILLLAFNVAVITYLIYRLLQVYQIPLPSSRKWFILSIGILLLIAPVSMVVGVVRYTPVYLIVYPVAISLFLYLIRDSLTNS